MVRVLIVDDQATFRQAARAVIELADGFDVAGEAETGEASVAASSRLRPDLVLMDIRLPGIDGLEASRRIRETMGRVLPRIILLSTYDSDDYAALRGECGADLFLSKSEFSPETLRSAWLAVITRCRS